MAYSRIVKIGDGATVSFAVSFALGYLAEDNITCRVGTEADGGGSPIYRTITFLGGGMLQISGAAPALGVEVVFERTTSKTTRAVDFSDGDNMAEDNLDLILQQAMLVTHEVLDGRIGPFQTDLDISGYKLTGVGDPTAAQDVATKNYVDTAGTSAAASAMASASEALASAGAASTHASTASAAAVSTANDVLLTAADVVTTTADAAATAGDRVQTGLDALATAADAVSTDADAVATAADRIAASGSASDAATSAGIASAAEAAVLSVAASVEGMSGFRNKIINGNFDHWQRGTSFAAVATGAYVADRFQYAYNGTPTINISRQAHVVGQTDVPGNPKYFLRIDQTVAGTGGTLNQLRHKIEGVQTMAGRTITVTIWAKASAPTDVTLACGQIFGSGGSSDVYMTGIPFGTLTTAWAKYSVTYNVDSIAGKIIGTSGDALQISLTFPRNVLQTIDISRVSVVVGDATAESDPYENRYVPQELELCKRFYRVYGGLDLYEPFALGYAASAITATMFKYFSSDMYSAPTLSYSALSDWALRVGAVGGITCTAISINRSTPRGVILYFTRSDASWTIGNMAQVQGSNTLSARMAFSAEI